MSERATILELLSTVIADKQICTIFERACYNNAIAESKADNTPLKWCTEFIERYSAFAYKIMAAPAAYVEYYNMHYSLDLLGVDNIVKMSIHDIDTKASELETERIRQRMAAKIEKKKSLTQTCGKCGGKNITKTEVQMRAADEASNFVYNCEDCYCSWIR